MKKVYELNGNERKIGEHLFKDNKYDTVLINSVLDGHTGRMLVDSDTNPKIARLDTGAFTMFGGDHDLEVVMDLIQYSPIYIITPENQKWTNIFMNVFMNRVVKLPFREYHSNTLNAEKLTEIIKKLPAGYELKRLDKELCEQLPLDISNEYFFENYISIDDFIKRGVGFCILFNEKIVSAATSMASSRYAIDIEIETEDNFRKKGLGTIVGAELVLYCIQNNIVPKWLAANKDSEKLAERLGFSKGVCYETFQIQE